MTATVIHVKPHEVEHGDLLFGRTWTPVDSILLDCSDGQDWVYGDEHGRTIARCKVWAQVQVIRDLPGEVSTSSMLSACPAVPSEEAEHPSRSASSLDDCPPHGITRSHGLLTVVQ
jgi:hypothetical protein